MTNYGWGSIYLPNMTLQGVLSQISACSEPVMPHHPITCCGSKQLLYQEDGALECDHAISEPASARVQAAVNHSIAILILEEATKL